MVIDCGTHTFVLPKRYVLEPNDIEKWEKSEAYQDYLGFLHSLNDAVKGKKNTIDCHVSDVTTGVIRLLDLLSEWIDDIPPTDQPQRYGNMAFREFYAQLKEKAPQAIRETLPSFFHAAVPEISVYFVEAFGNSTRIDYGTGHELSFLLFLTCLFKIGALQQEDSVAVVNRIFCRYLEIARKLQSTYKMEPAGSQGVWSLDDHQFVPFVWGSSQLVMHPKVAPEMFTKESVVDTYMNDFIFLSAVKYIMEVKTGPFSEHSNQLWNVSAVSSWSKINQGLIKMYKAEVLHKFPVIQHVLFGSILSFDAAKDIRFQAGGHELMGSMLPPPTMGYPMPSYTNMPQRVHETDTHMPDDDIMGRMPVLGKPK